MNYPRVHMHLSHVQVCNRIARRLDLGGVTHINRDHQKEYQLAGQMGELVLHWCLSKTLEDYLARRRRIDQLRSEDPQSGDDGTDVDGYSVDIKTSTIRHPHMPLSSYHLWVRKADRRAKFYVQAMQRGYDVWILGWAASHELQQDPEIDDRLTVDARELHPWRPFAVEAPSQAFPAG